MFYTITQTNSGAYTIRKVLERENVSSMRTIAGTVIFKGLKYSESNQKELQGWLDEANVKENKVAEYLNEKYNEKYFGEEELELEDDFERNLELETFLELYDKYIIRDKAKESIKFSFDEDNSYISISLAYRNTTALSFIRSEGKAISTRNNGYIYSLPAYVEDLNDLLEAVYRDYDAISFKKFNKGEYIDFDKAKKIDLAYEESGESAYSEYEREISIKL